MRLEIDPAPYDRDDDLDGPWTREQLITMSLRFAMALEQAFELGLESRKSAAAEVKLPASPGPRRSTPLCATALDGLLRSTMDGLVFVARG
jgi:hypothetical protein